MSEFTPTVWVDELDGRVRLSLEGFLSAEGPTLQEAADELVAKTLVTVMAFRSHGIGGLSATGRPRIELVNYLWELSRITAGGGDIRERLFGWGDVAA